MTEKDNEDFEKIDKFKLCEMNFKKFEDTKCRIFEKLVTQYIAVNNFKTKNSREEQQLIKLRNHDHLKDKLRRAALVGSNLKARPPKTLLKPMVLLSMSRYDPNLFKKRTLSTKTKERDS